MGLKYFGTDGIRGKVGDLITPSFIKRIANALQGKSAIIGHDTRESCKWIVPIFNAENVGVVTTAQLAFLTLYHKADVGIMVTASHNPPEWNGIKLFDSSGEKLGDQELIEIEKRIDNPWQAHLIKHFEFLKSWEDKPKVLIDCVNGSGAENAKVVFGELGFEFVDLSTGGEINEVAI